MTRQAPKLSISDVPLWLIAFVAICLFSAGALLVLYFVKFRSGLSQQQEVWGQFGDYIGGILNPLFALAALFALLYTMVLQSAELRDSAEQLRKSAEALQTQNAVLTKQTFEATYFQLVALFNGVARDMQITLTPFQDPQNEGGTFENRQCIQKLLEILNGTFLNKVARGDQNVPLSEAIDVEYSRFYEVYGHVVGHYFRTIYNVIKFVDLSLLPEQEKKFYTNLVRAQISKPELGPLFYNCVSHYGNERFLPLVLKYRLLKHLEDGVLLDPSHRNLLDGF